MNKGKGKKFALYWGVFTLVIIMAFVILWNICPYRSYNQQVVLPVDTPIEKAISVKGLTNEVVYTGEIRGLFVSGETVGAGMGAPVVLVKDIDQFLYLVPGNERIYTAVGQARTSNGKIDPYAAKKVYWAFIENRAGIIVYENICSYGPWWYVDGFDEQGIVFSTPTYENGYTIMVGFLLFCLWVVASLVVAIKATD